MFTAAFHERNQVAEARLATRTTMRVGGPATVVAFNDRATLPELLDAPHRWLGTGANLLVDDAGVSEAVVVLGPTFETCDIGEVRGGRARVRVGAAVDLAELISKCVTAGLAGPEGLSGVPASVGGALRMNAGTSTCWMLDWVARVEVVLAGEREPRWLERAELPASYRDSGLPHGTLFLGCELDLASGDPVALRAQGAKLKKAKAATQPLALASAGCVFKNPTPQLPAGKLIDELGLKGTRVGGAMISPVHANFIVNPERSATSHDIASLIRIIRDRAWRERGVELRMEVETWNCPTDLHAHPKDVARVEV